MKTTFHQRLVRLIKKIPRGKVATYGQIARMAGNPRAARQVVWVLNSSWEKEKLPWYRVINSKGQISLKPGQGYELQKSLLEKEGVLFDDHGRVNLERFLWTPLKI
ncbi:MAG: MGMT family protein [candidate division Zixibacteria bacterium]|nr:MGMT family protein [candidate division Zixibacteria bacterium]MDD5425192.1 MGMT family protein [candidate division Zixibacteria bacterium]